MTWHRDGVVSDAEEVHLDCAQQAELVGITGLELLSCLEAVHKLRHLLLAADRCPVTNTMNHLHLHSIHAQRKLRNHTLLVKYRFCGSASAITSKTKSSANTRDTLQETCIRNRFKKSVDASPCSNSCRTELRLFGTKKFVQKARQTCEFLVWVDL